MEPSRDAEVSAGTSPQGLRKTSGQPSPSRALPYCGPDTRAPGVCLFPSRHEELITEQDHEVTPTNRRLSGTGSCDLPTSHVPSG